jgi:hypothetical protein
MLEGFLMFTGMVVLGCVIGNFITVAIISLLQR